jgi:hypothetical protein
MADKSLFNRETLADDESRMARFSNLTAAEKARIRAQQQEELKSTESQKTRPLGSRMLDAMYENLGTPAQREFTRKAAEEDAAQRSQRYEAAKARAGMSDEDLAKEPRLYGTDRKVKLADNPVGMKKGGAVRSASSRADGIAKRGKTRGRMV